jgi:hypothetical protein
MAFHGCACEGVSECMEEVGSKHVATHAFTIFNTTLKYTFGMVRRSAPVELCQECPDLWVALRGQGLPNQKVDLRSIDSKGRGLLAQCKIAKGTQLLEVCYVD